MQRHSKETIGVRYTGWAALDRDPQEDQVEFVCPHCGPVRNEGGATRTGALSFYGRVSAGHPRRGDDLPQLPDVAAHIAPVVMLHDEGEKRRFQAVFAVDPGAGANRSNGAAAS